MNSGRFSHRVMQHWLLVWTLLGALFWTACATPQQRRYYTLALPSRSAPESARFDKEVWVREAEIAPVLNRPQVVYRLTPTELQFYAFDYWADRPARMVTQLIESELRASGLFRSVTSRLGSRPPEFQLETTVLAMEQQRAEENYYAFLSINFRLIRFEDSAVIWQHTYSERRQVNSLEVGLTARALSDMLTEQLAQAFESISEALAPPREAGKSAASSNGGQVGADAPSRKGHTKRSNTTTVPPEEPKIRTLTPSDEKEKGTEKRDSTFSSVIVLEAEEGEKNEDVIDWSHHPQFTSDETDVPPGYGAVFLPAISNFPSREPSVEVYQGETYLKTGNMGERIPLPPGHYFVHFGSGTLSQRLIKEVNVVADRVTLIKPYWSTLEVNVVSETFVPFRGSFELLDMSTRELMGQGYGADQELGEESEIWLLTPGLYKIVQPGASYRSRRNFATVYLSSATHIPFTLVLDRTTRDFLGAGIAEQVEESQDREKRWSYRSTLGGDLTWIRRSAESSAQAGTTVGVNFYADNMLRFKSAPHLWTTRFEVEEGSSLEGPEKFSSTWWDESRSVSSADRLYLNSIYIYELNPRMGPYVRVGGETYLQNRYKDITPNDDGSFPTIQILDTDGEVICSTQSSARAQRQSDPLASASEVCDRLGSDRIRLAGAFSPFELKQGFGVNFRVLHRVGLDIDVRAGLGGRQSLQAGRLRFRENDLSDGIWKFEQVPSSFVVGPEVTLLASGRVTRYFQASTELDGLVPFLDGFENRQFTWRNTASLRLSSFASLVYSLNLDRNPNVSRNNPLVIDQSLLLRFSFDPF